MGIPFVKMPHKTTKEKDTLGDLHFELHFKKIEIDLITTKRQKSFQSKTNKNQLVVRVKFLGF
jgi:hypothetical protein